MNSLRETRLSSNGAPSTRTRKAENADILPAHLRSSIPTAPDLRDNREALPDGWLVSTNLNNVLKKTVIRLASEVAGLSFGKDVIVEF